MAEWDLPEGTPQPPRYVQLGCGDHRLPFPWENYDAEIDITQRLPFADSSIDRIFCEHTIEHVTQQQGVEFLRECFRVLRPGGVLRLSFPAVRWEYSGRYKAFVADRMGIASGDGEAQCDRFILWGSGHLSIWAVHEALCLLRAIGFVRPISMGYGKSDRPELRDIDGHHHAVGLPIAAEETDIVEAEKESTP
jgi:SAM-dependent methyltransferase